MQFELHAGRGYQALGELELAQSWLERAAGTAKAGGPSIDQVVRAAHYPDGLPKGIVWIQYRTENCRLLPVFGKEALNLSPRVGHLHVRVDDLHVHHLRPQSGCSSFASW